MERQRLGLGRVISRGFQSYWRASRGLVLRVEGCLVNEAGRVLLTRAGDGSIRQLPGDLVRAGETAEEALWRSLRQESIEATAAELIWVYAGAQAAPWDAVALYRLSGNGAPASAQAAYFPADALRQVCDVGTLARVKDAVSGRTPFEVC